MEKDDHNTLLEVWFFLVWVFSWGVHLFDSGAQQHRVYIIGNDLDCISQGISERVRRSQTDDKRLLFHGIPQ